MIQVSFILFYIALNRIICKSLENRHGLDIIFNTNYKIYAADAFLAKNLYFMILQDNGKSLLKTTNFTRINIGEMQDVLKYPVQSAESVAVDWVNGNLYWADQKNQFIEVVDLNGGLNFPISRHRRRILFSRSFGDIYSLVVDPWEQYIFWVQVGAFLVLERARLDGSDRRVISSKPFHFKSSRLAIDRHRKMLFWWGLDGVIHRVDYQGQTGCKMQLEGGISGWKNWNPTYFTFAEGKLVFINDDILWASAFQCGSGTPMMLTTNSNMIPAALIATKYQLTIPGGKIRSRCVDKVCSSICLPTVESNYRCACMTGIDITIEKSICPEFPTQSLFIGSPPKIYHISLDGQKQPLELLSEQAGIPFRFAYDSITSSLLYVDFNASSILSLDLNQYGPPQKLILDFPILSEVPVSIAIDSISRNIYWMNHRNSEVWVARISRSNRLKYATLLLSWLPNPLFRDTRNQHDQPPGEIAVDSTNHYLFVTVIGDGICSIERYWLDGSQKFTVISSNNNFWPRGLTLDEKGQKIYFMDSERDEMICIDYNGENKRVIAGKFQEFFDLSYYDNSIYWTEMEALSIHVIKSDGSRSSVLMKTRNLDARTMPVIAVSRNISMDVDSPCHDSSNKCDQLCFPTRVNKNSFLCGCSNPGHILLNKTRCTYSSEMIVYFNMSTVIIHQLAPNINKQSIVLGNENSDVRVGSLQMDYFRNQIYWIDEASNCIMKTTNNIDVRLQWKVFCLFSDVISNIGLDAVRNNLYASITSRSWSRILIIRLPFYYSVASSVSLIVSTQNTNKILGAVTVHSDLKFMFWFEAQTKDRFNVVEIYQAYLDGTHPILIWTGRADIDELTVDDQANHICWRYSVKGIIYKYDIINKKLEIFQLSSDILNQVNISSSEWLHVYSMMPSLYLYMNDSIFRVNLFERSSLITRRLLKLVLEIKNFVPVRGFSFVSRSSSASTKKVAVAKTNANIESVIMCPTSKTEVSVPCSQFCLPVKQKKCGCGSIYSLSLDGSTCLDSNDLIFVMTKTGEIIGIRGIIDEDKEEDIQFVEWIEVAEQQGDAGQKFIDAVYWLSRNIVLRLDSHGYISAVDRKRPFPSIKKYKKLIVQDDHVRSNRKYNSNYEKVYKHFAEKDDVEFKDHYITVRFSLAIDPNSGTLVWSDWVNGVIAAERLNSQVDQIEFLGIIIDFRQSSRRPLQIAIAPISSSLIWLSADLPLSALNETSMWRNFWIEMSDLDGSRRSVLTKDPGVPSCLTVDVDSGKIYWIDRQTNKLMYLNINWGDYQIRAGHVIGYKMKVTVDSLITTGIPLYGMGSFTTAMVILKKYLFWNDRSQQIFASTSINSNILKSFNEIGSVSDRTRIYNLPYLKNKLNGIVRIMARMAPQDFKISSLGTLLQNHPCSHAAQALTNKRCSHFCLSTIPIRLAEEYSYLMTEVQLADKFRCSCPLSMSVTHKVGHKFSACVESQLIKCERYHIPCKAGLVFSKKEGMSVMSCMPIQQRCDSIEDCLDGSDEVGCNTCNSSHIYSCSGSGLCLPLNKRCNGIIDCDSDEKCCSSQKFECLSGKDSSRCLTISDRCNGIVDCKDGSDEHNCNRNIKGGLMSSTDDYSAVGHLSNNHTVAIIAGSIAISACSIAIIYIFLSRRYRRKTVHESCLFRANNVNIMFMSPSQKPSRRYRFTTPYNRPNASSGENLSHAKSCDIIDNDNYYNSDPNTQSLNSLSDCYRRIKNPHPCPCSIMGRPLFSMHDDILFQLSRIRKQTEHCASNTSIKKIEKPPPSVITANSEEMEKPEDQIITNNDMMSRNSFLSSPCESELEEIYVHRYQLRRRPSQFDNYPSCLLQNLLSACNQTPKLCNTPITTSRDLVVENIYRRRRRKLFKYRRTRNSSKANLSLSPSRRSRPDYSQNNFELYHNSSSNLNISPPPPSPITVVSA